MKNKIATVLAVLFGVGVAQFGMDYYRDWRVSNTAEREIADLRATASEENPNMPEILALQEAADSRAIELLNNSSDEQEARENAAGVFLGYYLINQRTRLSYCSELGADVSDFVRAFEKLHFRQYELATQVLSMDAPAVDDFYQLLEPQMVPVIRDDIAYIASEYEISLGEACQLISNNASQLVADMNFAIAQPEVNAVLMEL